jgi:O-antigen ligase
MVLIGAQARTSIAALTISIVVMAYFIPKLRWLSYCIAILAIVLVVYYQISGTELGIMDSITNYLRRGATDQQLSSLSGRTELWQAGFRMFKDSPFIGYGFQAGARMAGAAYGVPNGTNMHSGHMQVLIDSGLVGYILWLMFVVSMLFLPISVLKKKVLSMKTEIGRFHLEVTLIMFVIFFRSFLGEVLVTHEISTMLFLGGYIYVLTNQILRRGGTGRVAEQELSGKPAQKLNYIPRRRQ